jgi:hypothetical protein
MASTCGKKARKQVGGKKSDLRRRKERKAISAEKQKRWSQMATTAEARKNNAVKNFLGERTIDEPTT